MFLTDRLRAYLTHQVRFQVEEATQPLMAVFGRIDDLSGQIDDVRRATIEVQRIVTDDLDAANETAALLGRALATLTASVDGLRTDVAALGGSGSTARR